MPRPTLLPSPSPSTRKARNRKGRATLTGNTSCTRSDSLGTGAAYPAITVAVNVAINAPASVTNSATVSGGGSFNATASDPTAIVALPRYSNPLAFAVPASVVGGVTATFSVTYASAAGAADIAHGQVQIDGCSFEWDTSLNLTLSGTGGSGVIGQGPILNNSHCVIDLANSSLTPVSGNPDALLLSLKINFAEQNMVGTHEVYASGTSAIGLSTAQIDLGALVVSQGADFVLNASPSDAVIVPAGGTVTMTVTAIPVNGFNSQVQLQISGVGTPGPCIRIYEFPTYLSMNQPAEITVNNLCHSAGAASQYQISATGGGVGRTAAVDPWFYPAVSGDFNVAVGTPSSPVLASQGSVTYDVGVTSVNSQTGTINLTVAALQGGTMPAGVTYSFSPASVSLLSNGTVHSTLTLASTASTPGGVFPLLVNGVLSSNNTQRSAPFGLATQTTTFQVNSVTGGGIVHNTGQEVQITHTVPSGTPPNYTSCTSTNPDVSCRIISRTPDAVIAGVTTSQSAEVGTSVINFDIAGGSVMFLAEPGRVSASVHYQSPFYASTPTPVYASVSGLPASCAATIDGIETQGCFATAVYIGYPLLSGSVALDPAGMPQYVSLDQGTYEVYVTFCDIDVDFESSGSCVQDGGSQVVVTAAPPPPPTPTLSVTSNGNSVAQGTCSQVGTSGAIYIDKSPAMPNLTATVVMSDASSPTETVTWNLFGTFDERDFRQPHPSLEWPSQWSTPYATATKSWTVDWSTVQPSGFVGGDAQFNWSYRGVPQPAFNFCILGKNPNLDDSWNALQSAATSGYWFIPFIGIEETALNQYCEPGKTEGEPYCRGGANSGLPIWGTPAGYGIMQRDPPTSTDMIWNWRSAITESLKEIAEKAGPMVYTGNIREPASNLQAYPFWIRQVRQWQTYNANAPANNQPHVDAPPDDNESPSCIFSMLLDASGNPIKTNGQPNTHWFGDAILIQQYNGNGPSGANYIVWNNPPGAVPTWSGAGSTTYVYNVCSCTNQNNLNACKHL
jgi:hypothetical protein